MPSELGGPGVSGRIPVGPRVDDVEHDMVRLRRHEAEHLLQDRVDDGVQPFGGEGVGVVLGLPDIDIAQPALGPPGQVGDKTRRSFLAQALLDTCLDLCGDRHVVGVGVSHLMPPTIGPN